MPLPPLPPPPAPPWPDPPIVKPLTVGDLLTVECDTTDGQRTVADVRALRVVKLGCGCRRVRARRPGPEIGSLMMEVLVGGCGLHDDDRHTETPNRTVASPSGEVPVAPPAGSNAASAGKGRPTAEMHNPRPGTGAPGGVPQTPERADAGLSHATRAARPTSPADRTDGPEAHDAAASGAAAGEVSNDCKDSPLPPGMQPDDLVYIAIPRHGITYHRYLPPASIPVPRPGRTGCDRMTRTGLKVTVKVALARYEALPCRRCWPPTTPDSA